MTDYVPVIIFCYRRKIDKLINSLLKNKEAKETGKPKHWSFGEFVRATGIGLISIFFVFLEEHPLLEVCVNSTL